MIDTSVISTSLIGTAANWALLMTESLSDDIAVSKWHALHTELYHSGSVRVYTARIKEVHF
jgi:hypothetical protein